METNNEKPQKEIPQRTHRLVLVQKRPQTATETNVTRRHSFGTSA